MQPQTNNHDEFSDDTACVIPPIVPLDGFASLSTPVYRASTIPFANAAAYRERAGRAPDGYSYGLGGTPTSRALEQQLASLHGATRGIVVPSGQAAITVPMLMLLDTGDHLLLADNVYPPVKQFSSEVLRRMGIDVEIFDPLDPSDLEARVQPGRTKLVWLESPGSTTMEVCDIPRLAEIARIAGALSGCDNTWATGLLCKPLRLGVDIVAEALTKYVGGHSDLLLGVTLFRDIELYRRMRQTLMALGIGVSPDECSLALRGIQTMGLRVRHVGETSMRIAAELSELPGLDVLHPGLPGSPSNDLWRRDFAGAAGVFSVRVQAVDDRVIDEALDALRIFAIGASWGGTRSIIAPMKIDADRQVMALGSPSTFLRISIGLESLDDLRADLVRLTERLLKNRHD